jgi:hypothetical protein
MKLENWRGFRGLPTWAGNGFSPMLYHLVWQVSIVLLMHLFISIFMGQVCVRVCVCVYACVCVRVCMCPCVQFMVVRQCVCNVYVSCMYDARTHTLTHTQVSKFQGKVVPESKPLQIDPEVFDSGRTRSLVTEHILSLLRASRCRLTPQWSRLRSPCVLE